MVSLSLKCPLILSIILVTGILSDSMFNISDFKLSGMGKYLLCSKDKEWLWDLIYLTWTFPSGLSEFLKREEIVTNTRCVKKSKHQVNKKGEKNYSYVCQCKESMLGI
jgi:hypothetical protein